MIDSQGRTIEYLRLSLTERCNLNCLYCRDSSPSLSATQELTADEITRIMRCMVELGIKKVRLTGGEPLLRNDLEQITRIVAQSGPIEDICMTTNAQGLGPRAAALKSAGLMRLNISLDSLNAERYATITRGGKLQQVLDGIDAAIDHGLLPIKLNCVLVRGTNDGEIGDFINLAREKPLHVRFIELMPVGAMGQNKKLRIETDEILREHPEFVALPPDYPGQPAEVYTADGFAGTVGFISPVSHKFCNACNRVRVTSDGVLKPCLGTNDETDLRAAMAQGDDALLEAIRTAIYNKPEGHHFQDGFDSSRRMNRIGG